MILCSFLLRWQLLAGGDIIYLDVVTAVCRWCDVIELGVEMAVGRSW